MRLQSSERRISTGEVGDKLTTRCFDIGTRGFAAPEGASIAVCLKPGTEISFAEEVKYVPLSLLAWRCKVIKHKRQSFVRLIRKKSQRITMRWSFQTAKWCF